MSGPAYITVVDPLKDLPIEIGWVNLWAGEYDLLDHPTAWDRVGPAVQCDLIDPGRPIPPESSAVHHLIDADLRDALPWTHVQTRVRDWLGEPVAFAAHSAKFERQWLTPDLVGARPWICTWKCALRAWPEAPAHGNQVLRYWLDPVGLDRQQATPAHRAGPDAYVTAHLLRALLQLHPLAVLLQWSAEPALLPRVTIGRPPPEGWRGCKWSEVDDGFLWWILDRDFSEEILFAARTERDRRQREEEDGA
jgi:exodeoxyribonuclease X